MRYRVKTHIVEARQYPPTAHRRKENMDELVAWVNSNSSVAICSHNGLHIFLETPDGLNVATCGDYIVKRNGEMYVIGQEDFDENYEIAE